VQNAALLSRQRDAEAAEARLAAMQAGLDTASQKASQASTTSEGLRARAVGAEREAARLERLLSGLEGERAALTAQVRDRDDGRCSSFMTHGPELRLKLPGFGPLGVSLSRFVKPATQPYVYTLGARGASLQGHIPPPSRWAKN
jgi:hypothetical protein